jgi:hypothetical protein
MNQSDRSYSAPAKEGAFVVQRLNTLTPAWLPSNTSNTLGVAGLLECYVHYKDSAGTPHTLTFVDPNSTSVNFVPLYDTRWSNDMTFAWVRFDGLTPQEGIAPATTNVNLMIHKYYSGFEVQPALTSPWSGLVKLAPKPDLAAMQALMDGFYDIKDCLPASYNFWGVLGNLGLKALKGAASEIFGGSNFVTKNGKLRKDVNVSDEQRSEFSTVTKGMKKLQRIDKKRGQIVRKQKVFNAPPTQKDADLLKEFAALRAELKSLKLGNSKSSRSSPKTTSSGPRRRRKPAPK